MCKIKMKQNGRFSLCLERQEAGYLRTALESHVIRVIDLQKFKDIDNVAKLKDSIYHTAICEIYHEHQFKLLMANEETKITISYSQALTLLLFLIGFDHVMTLLTIKAELHKALLG
jgi:hypothetical protein